MKCVSRLLFIYLLYYGLLLFFIKREGHSELGALIRLAVDCDFAVIQINNSLDYRQAETVALSASA